MYGRPCVCVYMCLCRRVVLQIVPCAEEALSKHLWGVGMFWKLHLNCLGAPVLHGHTSLHEGLFVAVCGQWRDQAGVCVFPIKPLFRAAPYVAN